MLQKFAFALVLGAATQAMPALAHGDKAHDKPAAKKKMSADQHAWGREGDPKKVTKTITIGMADTMRFSPDKLEIKEGETVRFVIQNKGQVLHELVLGSEDELKKHAEVMKKFPSMEHEEPYMAHVKPGKQEGMVWQFNKAGTFTYGCLIPGHWEAGMKGTIVVAAAGKK